MQSYLDDCNRTGTPVNPVQVTLFTYSTQHYIALPGPRFIMMPLSKLLSFIIAIVIGKCLLGLSHSYPEYYNPKSR